MGETTTITPKVLQDIAMRRGMMLREDQAQDIIDTKLNTAREKGGYKGELQNYKRGDLESLIAQYLGVSFMDRAHRGEEPKPIPEQTPAFVGGKIEDLLSQDDLAKLNRGSKTRSNF